MPEENLLEPLEEVVRMQNVGWGQANNQRMLEKADAYLGVLLLPHGQLGRRARSEAVASNPY